MLQKAIQKESTSSLWMIFAIQAKTWFWKLCQENASCCVDVEAISAPARFRSSMPQRYIWSATVLLVACFRYVALHATSAEISVWVIILSRRDALKRRAEVRDLWQQASHDKCAVAFKFVLCEKPKPSGREAELIDAEHQSFGDIQLVDCEEGYSRGRLVQKVRAGMNFFLSQSAQSDPSLIGSFQFLCIQCSQLRKLAMPLRLPLQHMASTAEACILLKARPLCPLHYRKQARRQRDRITSLDV